MSGIRGRSRKLGGRLHFANGENLHGLDNYSDAALSAAQAA